jgi:phage N-6-adenine-methyltransferase
VKPQIDIVDAQKLLAELMRKPVEEQVVWAHANRNHPIARTLRSCLSATGAEGAGADGASISRGSVEEDAEYVTPPDLMQAVGERFWTPDVDLAASAGSAQARRFLTRDDNALVVDWSDRYGKRTRCWLNPPYGKSRWSPGIYPWVHKAHAETRDDLEVLVLVPVSTGKWFRECCWGKADVYLLSDRITFVGETACYPKDCMILHYHAKAAGLVWLWHWTTDELLPLPGIVSEGSVRVCKSCGKGLVNKDGLMEPPEESRGFCKACRKRVADKQTSLLET